MKFQVVERNGEKMLVPAEENNRHLPVPKQNGSLAVPEMKHGDIVEIVNEWVPVTKDMTVAAIDAAKDARTMMEFFETIEIIEEHD